MQRFTINALEKWKNSAVRKPLVLYGARQVGKTWLMKEFGRLRFKSVSRCTSSTPGIRTSQKEYGKTGGLYDIPLYGIGRFREFLAK